LRPDPLSAFVGVEDPSFELVDDVQSLRPLLAARPQTSRVGW
jgi:hypothetical protein